MTEFGESEVVPTTESCAEESRGEFPRTEGMGIYPSAGGDEVGTDAESEVEVLCKGLGRSQRYMSAG